MLATGIASTSAQSVSNRLNPFSTKKGDAYFIENKFNLSKIVYIMI